MNGRKDDAGKPRPSLVLNSMARAIARVIDVAEYGARKYAPDNWLQVPDGVKRYTDAGLRHRQAHALGEVNDPESGLPHLAHAAWCALAVLELQEREQEAARPYIGGESVIAQAAVEQEKINELVSAAVAEQELAEVVRQLRKDPKAREAMDLHGVRVHRSVSDPVNGGIECTAPDGARVFRVSGPVDQVNRWAKAGRRALRAYTAQEELRHLILGEVKDPRAYLTALHEGLLWVERETPGIISIKDRSKQKLREVHGADLADAWKRLRQMPDVDRLMNQITARFPAAGGTRLCPPAPKRVDGTEVGGPATSATPDPRAQPIPPRVWEAPAELSPKAVQAGLDAQLEELTKAHPDRRFEQARRAGKLKVRKDGGAISLGLGDLRVVGLSPTLAFSALAKWHRVDSRLTEVLEDVDHGVAYWQDQLRKDPICADGLRDGWLAVRRAGRTIVVWVDRSWLGLLLKPLCAVVCDVVPAALIKWVHDARPRAP